MVSERYLNKRNKFIRGPLDIYQINRFLEYGVNAVRIFLYIRMREGQLVSANELKPKEHTFIVLDNKTMEALIGIHKSNKWPNLRKLEAAKLIEIESAKGKAPKVKIVCPIYH
tara:strand:+ start:1638 stop:1976 length:339 start_codon:yes stop_codon:yes gene_type:complete